MSDDGSYKWMKEAYGNAVERQAHEWRAGTVNERLRIVAWLRRQSEAADGRMAAATARSQALMLAAERDAIGWAADEIEAGAHAALAPGSEVTP